MTVVGVVGVSTAFIDAIGRWAVTIRLVGAVAGTGVLLVGLARLRWLRASSRRVTDGPWHRLCCDLARSCGLPASIVVAGLQVAAQTSRITGTVVDQAGHVVQNPGLTLTNRATAEQLRVTGDDAGRFEFAELEPAEYSLVVGKPGFERLFRRFSLEGGEQIEEELVLRLGSVEETIVVTDTGESPTAARTISAATRARYLEHRNQGGTIAPPIKIRDLTPVYPASIRGSGFEGKVVLEAQIQTDGTVEVLQILAPMDPATMTTVYPDLARSAVEAVGGWRYEPTLLHGVPVDTRMTINVTFRP